MKTNQKLSRYETIRLSLANLTYATSEQLRIINNLRGDRNARRILLDMERRGYIKSVRHEKKIYYTDTRLKKKEIPHILMRNDLFIELGMPSDWKKEMPIRKNGELLLIPDAMFTKDNKYHFVEVDHMQQMKNNYEKIRKYKDVNKLIFHQFKHHPTIIFRTIDARRNKIDEACKRQGIKYVVM